MTIDSGKGNFVEKLTLTAGSWMEAESEAS